MNKLYFEEITNKRIDLTDTDTLKAIKEEIEVELSERKKERAIELFNKFIGALHEMAEIDPYWILFIDRDDCEWTTRDLLDGIAENGVSNIDPKI